MTQSSALHAIDHHDRGGDFDRLTIEDGGFVPPLLNCFHRRLLEEWITSNDLQGPDSAVGPNDGAQFHAAFPVRLLCQRRIARLDTVDQHRRIKLRKTQAPRLRHFAILAVRGTHFLRLIKNRNQVGWCARNSWPETFGWRLVSPIAGRGKIMYRDRGRDVNWGTDVTYVLRAVGTLRRARIVRNAPVGGIRRNRCRVG